MSVIASHFPGRLRIRCPKLRNDGLLTALSADFRSWSGVRNVRGERRSGSIVILYDDKAIAFSVLEERISARLALTDIAPNARPPITRANRLVKIGMLVSLAAAIGGLGVSRRAHAAAGGALLMFLLLHMAMQRRALLR
ncbi:hypothetical protein FACS1894205_1060 [Alphaproteobacteria bacterium]|nr:hypothetical protein FACS1894205_1060 [Alphaproteobacteria bacterium]